jgi:hypothetical protein
MSEDLDVIQTARLVAAGRVHCVSDESTKALAQALLDLEEACKRTMSLNWAQNELAKAELRRGK